MEDKTLLITIKPQHLCNILNGIKTIEVRKNKNLANAVKKLIGKYDGNCRIKCVCSKSNLWLIHDKRCNYYYTLNKSKSAETDVEDTVLNGKVACEIVVDSVDDIVMGYCPRTRNMPREDQEEEFQTIDFEEKELCKRACLTEEEFHNYLEDKIEKSNDWWNEIFGYALHIKTVIPYEKPKELKEFYKVGAKEAFKELEADLEEFKGYPNYSDCSTYYQEFGEKYRLQKAPQNFCYVEEE